MRSLRERRASVAVIARYGAQANIYYEGLKNAEVPALRRVYGKEFTFAPGIDVVDVAQIKGLEYDYVVLVEVNHNTYGNANEARHLLHIASTRAVYQLWATSVGTPRRCCLLSCDVHVCVHVNVDVHEHEHEHEHEHDFGAE